MDTVTLLLTVRDNLRTNLTDPYTLFTPAATARDGSYWIFYDEPHAGVKYPKVEILKADNSTTVIAQGSPYTDMEEVYFNVFFYLKNGTSITVDGTTYTNTQAVEYYLGKIKSTIKSQFDTLFDAGVKGIKAVDSPKPEYDQQTQLYYGYVTFRAYFFNLGC